METTPPILIDSSAWIALFTDRPEAAGVAKYLSNTENLLVPTLVIYEVYRHLCRAIGIEQALQYTAQLDDGLVIPLDENAAMFAAELSLNHKLGTADSVIYATSLIHRAKLVTLDNDFRDLPGCVVLE